MFSVKTANQSISDASRRPDPPDLYMGLWREGEVGCLFADSNLGKSIYAVQMADAIAKEMPVLYVDCELSEKQFQLRYTDEASGETHVFPERLYRAEINPETLDVRDYEEKIMQHLEALALELECSTLIIDNLGYLSNSSEKGESAGILMMKLMNLKKRHGWSVLVIAHTPKRNLSSPITQNDLAGSKRLFNFFDSVFAIGKSARDDGLRYVKQLKARSGEIQYGGDCVLVYEIGKVNGFLQFLPKGMAAEKEHLSEQSLSEKDLEKERVLDCKKKGMTVRQAADFTGLSKSKVGRYYKDLSQNVPVSQGISFGTGAEPDWILSFSPQDRTNILSLVDELELSISSASG